MRDLHKIQEFFSKSLKEDMFGDPLDQIFRQYAGKTIEMDFTDPESDWSEMLGELGEYLPDDQLSDFMESEELDSYLDDYNIRLIDPIVDKEIDRDVLKRAKAKYDIDAMRKAANMPPLDSIASLNEDFDASKFGLPKKITTNMWDKDKVKADIENGKITQPKWFDEDHEIIDINTKMDMISFDKVYQSNNKRGLPFLNKYLKTPLKLKTPEEAKGKLSVKENMSFSDYSNKELAAYCKKNPTDKKAAVELHKRSQALKNLSRTDEAKKETGVDNNSIDYTKLISLIKSANNPRNLPIYYNSDNGVVNIGGVGYDKGELVKMFNSQPGQSLDIKNLFYKANQNPEETKNAIESMDPSIKVEIGYGYGNEPFVKYIKALMNEDFAKFDTLKMAINQHEKGEPYYDKTRLINIFNQLDNPDQERAKKEYSEYFGKSVNESNGFKSGKAKPYKPKYNPMASLGGGKGYHIDEDKFDDKITNLKKYTYTLNGKKVTPEIGYFDHSLKAMISTPRSGDEYFDYEFYRIGEPDESGNIELSPEKGKKGMYTEEMNTSGFKSGKEFINIKLQNYPKAVAKINQLIDMIGEDKFTMEMAMWIMDFFNNASYESPVNEAVKEVVLSNEILDFLEERGILKGSDAQKVHKDLTAFLKEKGILQMEDYDEIVNTADYLKNNLSEATKDEETTFHTKLDKLVHDTFGKRKGELEEAYVPSNIAEFAKRRGVSSLVRKVAGWAEKVGARITGGTAIGKGYNTLILDMGYQTADIRIDVEDETIELYDEPIYSFNDFKRVFMEEVSRSQAEHDEEQLRRERGLEEIKQRVFNKLKK